MAKYFVFAATLALIFAAYDVLGAVQKITVYEKPGQLGDSVTLTKKYGNISDLCELNAILSSNPYGSVCAIGCWHFFEEQDFGSQILFLIDTVDEACLDFSNNLGSTKSIRYAGPEDFSTPAIAFYEGDAGGKELIVTGTAEPNIALNPRTALSFAKTNWTLFSGRDFAGDSTCFEPNLNFGSVSGYTSFNLTFVAQSVVRGCDALEVAANIQLFKNSIHN